MNDALRALLTECIDYAGLFPPAALSMDEAVANYAAYRAGQDAWALGRIVEGLSHSSFWPKMAILVVEDDAQDAVDHVDGHRTVALVASPWARRGVVDSTFYSQPSMVKTIELMLGLPALSMYDLVATDMRASFLGHSEAPDLSPFRALVPQQRLDEYNVKVGSIAGPFARERRDRRPGGSGAAPAFLGARGTGAGPCEPAGPRGIPRRPGPSRSGRLRAVAPPRRHPTRPAPAAHKPPRGRKACCPVARTGRAA